MFFSFNWLYFLTKKTVYESFWERLYQDMLWITIMPGFACYPQSKYPVLALEIRKPLFSTLKLRIWVLAYLKFIIKFLRLFFSFLNFILCNCLVRTLQYIFLWINIYFVPKNMKKSCSQSAQYFFSVLVQLPKRMAQKTLNAGLGI